MNSFFGALQSEQIGKLNATVNEVIDAMNTPADMDLSSFTGMVSYCPVCMQLLTHGFADGKRRETMVLCVDVSLPNLDLRASWRPQVAPLVGHQSWN